MSQTSHISTSGGLISTAFIENIRQARTNQRGTQPDTFALPWQEAPKSPAALEARIAETWEALLERWDAIATELTKMDISQARDRWILPLLRALDFQPIYQRSDIVLDESEALRFNVSHFGWELGEGENEANHTPPPVHTVLPTASLDARTTGATNSRSPKGKSPHDMLQLFLNVSRGYRWAVLTNGLHLRLLRDYHHTYTKGYVEFDLESIFETRNFADFRALYRLAHASRFVGPAPTPELSETSELLEISGQERWESAPLEMFYRDSQAAGIQVGTDLQKQVREAIEMLGNGFLLSGGPLLRQLQTDTALCQQFYAELLHIVYRILFLLYAEQRGMVPKTGAPLENLYRQGYSLTALRSKAESDPTSPEAYDLWEGLKVTFKMFQKGVVELGVYRYNGMLFAEDQTPLLDGRGTEEQGSGGDNSLLPQPLRCRNLELLRAIRALTLIEREGALQRISYADLNVEEIGGIYESLLDFAPRVTTGAEDVDGRAISPNTFFLDPRGTARKTTGSYYTHPSLVNTLIESALIPVLEDRLAEVQRRKGEREQGSRGEKDSSLPVDHVAAEQAILSLKVCDPAMGSGHFLIAANNALALHLAQIRTGDEYPAERELRQARRDVLAHCIYGVDLNPMAVELCKVALWINAAVDDAPLSFLDHHLKCGNSLIGATPDLLEQGIPDDAFQPVTDDDPKVAAAVRKRNRQERAGQLSLWRVTVLESLADLNRWRALNELAEAEPQIAERRYAEYRAAPAYRHNKLVADLWTAAFFWPLDEDSDLIPTEELFRQAQADPKLLPDRIKEQTAQLAERHKFFHWHLEYRDVFSENGKGGFDVVLGNPPWEKVQPEERGFFIWSRPDIATSTGSNRKKLLKDLERQHSALWKSWITHKAEIEGFGNFIRASQKYSLSSVGNLNTSVIFVDLCFSLISSSGQVGIIVPSSIATNSITKDFFASLVSNQAIRTLYDFENRRGLFPEVDSRFRFCLLTLSGKRMTSKESDFSFFLTDIDQISDPDRHFTLSKEDFRLLSPNTETSPTFQTKKDAAITKHLYRQAGVFIVDGPPEKNPWNARIYAEMFNVTRASHLFNEAEKLKDEGCRLNGNRFACQNRTYLPIYEARMLGHFDHRGASVGVNPDNVFRSAVSDETNLEEHQAADFFAMPRYWLNERDFQHKILEEYDSKWLLGFRMVTAATNERTMIATIFPCIPYVNSISVIFNSMGAQLNSTLVANLSSFVLDYAARQRMSGVNLNFFVAKQLPVLPPDRYTPTLLAYIVPHVLELTYTAWDLRAFVDDVWSEAGQGSKGAEERGGKTSNLRQAILQQWEENRNATRGGHQGAVPPVWAEEQGSRGTRERFPKPPFKWDEIRRAQLRADLDGLYGHLYGLTRDELAYILDTFPIVRRKDEAQFGEYRTKRMVLEAYDKLKGRVI